MSQSVFLKPKEFYQRHVNPIKQYVDQAALFLSIRSGDSIEICRDFVAKGIRDKTFPKIVDPTIHYFEREDNGDRVKKESNLSQYIGSVVKSNYLLVPSGTVYLHPSVKTSMLVTFIAKNVKRRSVAKKEAFKAKAAGFTDIFIIKHNEQTNMKLYNNSLSGAFVSNGTPLTNPTAHSTLTSTTRSVSSFGNSSNERVISGNRHYWSPDTALNNVISSISIGEPEVVRNAIEQFNLVYPTTDDVMSCITYSSDLYWTNNRALKSIRKTVDKMSDVQKAIFVYSGDLYHIRKHNDSFMRDFLGQLCSKVVWKESIENAADKIRSIDEQVVNFAHQICCDEIKGLGKDYPKMEEKGVLSTVLKTAENIVSVVEKYREFINAFFLSLNIPPTIAYMPSMIRRCAVLSDTDSTCFSTDEWVTWSRGKVVFDSEAMALAGGVSYIATQALAHILAVFSANINVERSKLNTLAMKGEFVFPTFCTTSVAKHYYCNIAIQEGNVFKTEELEVKGVHLKSSSSPPSITKQAKTMMETILSTVESGNLISLKKILTEIADTERRIITSLLDGQLEFYRQSKIKEPEAYTKDSENSPYQHYLLWKEVFAPKYGDIDPPPFGVAKIPSMLENKTDILRWLDTMVDKDVAARMEKWLARKNKTSMPTFYISANYLLSSGMIPELKPIIATKKIVMDLTNVFRLISESIGYFPKSGYMISELGY